MAAVESQQNQAALSIDEIKRKYGNERKLMECTFSKPNHLPQDNQV